MKRILVLFFVFHCTSAIAQQYPNLPLEKMLSKDEQTAIGITKLSNSEREKLRIFIIEKYLAGVEHGKKIGIEQTVEYFTKQQAVPSSDVIEGQIKGEYKGWEGETVIKLIDGQIWQQTEYYYHYHYAYMPKVLIYKSGIGYKMKVDGIEKAVGVKRLK